MGVISIALYTILLTTLATVTWFHSPSLLSLGGGKTHTASASSAGRANASSSSGNGSASVSVGTNVNILNATSVGSSWGNVSAAGDIANAELELQSIGILTAINGSKIIIDKASNGSILDLKTGPKTENSIDKDANLNGSNVTFVLELPSNSSASAPETTVTTLINANTSRSNFTQEIATKLLNPTVTNVVDPKTNASQVTVTPDIPHKNSALNTLLSLNEKDTQTNIPKVNLELPPNEPIFTPETTAAAFIANYNNRPKVTFDTHFNQTTAKNQTKTEIVKDTNVNVNSSEVKVTPNLQLKTPASQPETNATSLIDQIIHRLKATLVLPTNRSTLNPAVTTTKTLFKPNIIERPSNVFEDRSSNKTALKMENKAGINNNNPNVTLELPLNKSMLVHEIKLTPLAFNSTKSKASFDLPSNKSKAVPNTAAAFIIMNSNGSKVTLDLPSNIVSLKPKTLPTVKKTNEPDGTLDLLPNKTVLDTQKQTATSLIDQGYLLSKVILDLPSNTLSVEPEIDLVPSLKPQVTATTSFFNNTNGHNVTQVLSSNKSTFVPETAATAFLISNTNVSKLNQGEDLPSTEAKATTLISIAHNPTAKTLDNNNSSFSNSTIFLSSNRTLELENATTTIIDDTTNGFISPMDIALKSSEILEPYTTATVLIAQNTNGSKVIPDLMSNSSTLSLEPAATAQILNSNNVVSNVTADFSPNNSLEVLFMENFNKSSVTPELVSNFSSIKTVATSKPITHPSHSESYVSQDVAQNRSNLKNEPLITVLPMQNTNIFNVIRYLDFNSLTLDSETAKESLTSMNASVANVTFNDKSNSSTSKITSETLPIETIKQSVNRSQAALDTVANISTLKNETITNVLDPNTNASPVPNYLSNHSLSSESRVTVPTLSAPSSDGSLVTAVLISNSSGLEGEIAMQPSLNMNNNVPHELVLNNSDLEPEAEVNLLSNKNTTVSKSALDPDVVVNGLPYVTETAAELLINNYTNLPDIILDLSKNSSVLEPEAATEPLDNSNTNVSNVSFDLAVNSSSMFQTEAIAEPLKMGASNITFKLPLNVSTIEPAAVTNRTSETLIDQHINGSHLNNSVESDYIVEPLNNTNYVSNVTLKSPFNASIVEAVATDNVVGNRMILEHEAKTQTLNNSTSNRKFLEPEARVEARNKENKILTESSYSNSL